MLHYAIVFLVIAIIAAIFGFSWDSRHFCMDCPCAICSILSSVYYFSDLQRKTIGLKRSRAVPYRRDRSPNRALSSDRFG